MNFGLSLYFNYLYFRGGFDHNFFFDLFDSLVIDDTFDLVDDLFDLLSADFDFSGYFNSSFDFHNIVNNSGIGSFLSDRYSYCDLFFMFKLNYFRDLDKFRGGDKLVDGNGNQFLIDKWYYFLNLDKNFLDFYYFIFNFNYFIFLNFNCNFISHLNYFIHFDCDHLFFMDGNSFGIFLQDQFLFCYDHFFLFFCVYFLEFDLFYNVMSLDGFLYNEWHFLLDVEGNLDLDWLYFCLVDLYFLVFYAISVDLDWHFFDNFIGDQFFHLDFNWFFLLHSDLNYLLDLNCFVFFFLHHYCFHYFHFDWYLNCLDFDLRDWNLYYL